MTRFERFAYPAVLIALLIAWVGMSRGNDALRRQAGGAAEPAAATGASR